MNIQENKNKETPRYYLQQLNERRHELNQRWDLKD